MYGGRSAVASDISRDRVTRLFQFLREYATIRFPYTRDVDQLRWSMWLSDLPVHPAVYIQRIVTGDGPDEAAAMPEPLLRIRRPRLSRPPQPPAALQDWLLATLSPAAQTCQW